jgi:cytochrome c biogenesis protein CcdA/thiol-disulfide isomerase/thioredoxin
MLTLLIFAFIAGFITIFSPCILSIAPILLAAGTGQSRYKPLGIIAGIVISFSFFTLALTAIVQATGISPDIFRSIAIVFIILFGLTMVVPALDNAFTMLTSRISRIGSAIETESTHIKTEFFSGLILGIALGLIWTPCAGPILATISALAATGGITFTTVLITIFYSMGAATPMLAICFGGEKIMQSTTALAPYTESIRKVFGIIIIMSALAIAFHVDTFIQEKVAHLFPSIDIEKSSRLQKELEMLNNSSSSSSEKMMAPELVGIADWINSKPLTLEQLRGKVILLDFWTYTCINCIRTLPHVVEWYNEYKDHGLEIIGVHTPEFAFEKDKSHVEDAVKRFHITYPVALDNDYKTWRAYDNHYWPAHYLIDQNGMIVKTHFGEGNYVEMENAICALLKLPACTKKDELPFRKTLTPETYLGFERGNKYNPSLAIQKNKPATYQHVDILGNDQVGLTGLWTVTADSIQSQSDNNSLELNFIANHVYLVMQSDKPQLLTVLLDGKPLPQQYYSKDMDAEGKIMVNKPRAYELIDLKKDYGRHTLTLQCNKGINAYVFTFGSSDK